MYQCRWCGGDLWIVSRWPTGKVLSFWIGLLFCFVGLLAVFMQNETYYECKHCKARQ